MTRRYYAWLHPYGAPATDTDGTPYGTLWVFRSEADRDAWVHAGPPYDDCGYREALQARHPWVRRVKRWDRGYMHSQVLVAGLCDDHRRAYGVKIRHGGHHRVPIEPPCVYYGDCPTPVADDLPDPL